MTMVTMIGATMKTCPALALVRIENQGELNTTISGTSVEFSNYLNVFLKIFKKVKYTGDYEFSNF